jgi:hypothetical protein
VRIAAIVLFLASMFIAGAPRLRELFRTANDLAPLTFESKRGRWFGKWYGAVAQLRETIPATATIDFVMLRAEARDIAVLGAAELQPRDVRLFDGWNAWRRRERAILLHDDRAANAVPGMPPTAADYVVVVDPNVEPPLQIVEAPR